MTQYIWLLEKETGLEWRKLRTHYDIPKLSAGCFASERILNFDRSTAHPAQKPVDLILEILKVNALSIIDPFLGTGTTALAAKKLNRKCIGIEIGEKYCEIAAKRCSQSVMKLET
jgi:site-specific DNA-methyltransferase (adenine-specific)